MVKLVTVATDNKGYFKWLEESCKRYNVNLIKLGWEKKWEGYSWKFTLMIDFLKSVDENELIIFIDGYDVLLLRPLDDIENLFNTIIQISNKKIIISSENNHNNLGMYIGSMIYFSNCKSFQINSGTYMGRAKDLLMILNTISNSSNFADYKDDQELMTINCRNNKDIYYIDNDNNIFLVITDPLKDIFTNNELKINNNKTITFNSSNPYFIHTNANTLMDGLILNLGYEITNNEIKNNYNYFKNNLFKTKLLNYTLFYNEPKKNLFYNKKIIIIIIIIIIMIIYYYRKKI